MTTDRATQWQAAEQWAPGASLRADVTSGDAYYAWLKRNNQDVSRDVARGVWKQWGETTKWKEVLAKWPSDQSIPRAWYAETQSQYVTGYGYKFNVSYIDSATQSVMNTDYYHVSDTRMTKAQQEAEIRGRFETGTGDIKGTVTEISRVAVYHKAGAKW